MSVLPATSPGTNRKAPPGIYQSQAGWDYNGNGKPYHWTYCYNATGGALTKGGVYGVSVSGASATTENPRLQTPAINGGAHQQFVVALEASANNSWARVATWGYVEALVEGTTDVAADDALIVVPGQLYLIKAGGLGLSQIAEALEAQTSNSAVLADIFLRGQEAPTQAGGVQYTEIALTNAQIKALRATPITLVAAPGAGRVLEFISAVLLLDYGGTNAFTETADNLAVKYNNGSGAAASETIETTGWIDQTADTMTIAVARNDQIVAKSGCENLPLVLHNTGDGEIGGNAANDNVIRVKVAFRIHITGW